ncbi:hypothetical protein EKPJFOCH_3948 [Methylobacterium thuringiense]|uniref:Uncharacterized protein n=1 Tax=Methylobacterium thuringiense TaxID=1003091 RepID=A0ABQ4TPZ6_9HYPH|nr:hypothetical protein EKPJFOCH_3948 [Methylobacterium thuringiense]
MGTLVLHEEPLVLCVEAREAAAAVAQDHGDPLGRHRAGHQAGIRERTARRGDREHGIAVASARDRDRKARQIRCLVDLSRDHA